MVVWVINTHFNILLMNFKTFELYLWLKLKLLCIIFCWSNSAFDVSSWLIIDKNLSVRSKLPADILAFSLSWRMFISQRHFSEHLLSTAFCNILLVIQTNHLTSCLIIRISFELEIFIWPLSIYYKSFETLQKFSINIGTHFAIFLESRAHVVFICFVK